MVNLRRAATLVTVAVLGGVSSTAGASELPSDLSSLQARATALRADLAGLRTEAAITAVRYEQAEDSLVRASRDSAQVDRGLEQARATSQGSTDQVNARVAAVYRSGGPAGMLASLLDARSPQELFSRYEGVTAVVRHDSRTRATAAASTARLTALSAQAGEQAGVQARLVTEMALATERLDALYRQQQDRIDAADTEVRRLVEQQRLVAAQAATRRLLAEQADRAAAAARAQALALAARPGPVREPVARTGSVVQLATGYPVVGGTAANAGDAVDPYAGPAAICPVGAAHGFSDTWHAPRSGGRLHQGTDVFAPEGSPAYAVVSGVIDKVGDGGLGGITLWLRGDNGDRYYYAHNRQNLVGVGQRVVVGQVIALVGRTGNAETTPAHVHFQAQPGGGYNANPYPWLAAICAG